MKFPRLFGFLSNVTNNQKGFTLIELMIAIAITALITGGAATAIFQVFNVNTLNSDHMTAIRQVQNAGFWISQDAQQARIVVTDDENAILILSWTNWDGVLHEVTYDIIGNELRRSHSVDGEVPVETLVAQFITLATATFPDPPGNKIKVIIGATVADANEQRTYEVSPRPID